MQPTHADVIQQALISDTDGCIAWPYATTTKGYGVTTVGGRQTRVTHLVLDGTGQPWHPPLGFMALHSCDNPSCINPRHLRWGTNSANMTDAVTRGRSRTPRLVGEAHPHARLSAESVRAIRVAHGEGVSQTDLARRFGVSISSVHAVVTGKTWGHVA